MVKHEQSKSAWSGASHKEVMHRNHAQLQRRLTSSRPLR